MADKNSFQVLSEGSPIVLNALTGKKTIASLKRDHKLGKTIYHIGSELAKDDFFVGVNTRKRTIKTVDILMAEDLSLADLFNFFPGLLSKKWLSQSQICKIYKHFKDHLAIDDLPNLFLIKKSEPMGVDEDEPWKNLQIVELIIDHEKDAFFRPVSDNLVFSKTIRPSKCRVFIPVERGQK